MSEQLGGDSLNLGKELSPSNKSKESGLASKEGVANFLGGKESISVAGLARCCVERSSLPCSKLMLCSQEEPFQGGCAHIMLARYVHSPIGKLSCFARSLKGGELPPYPSRTSRSNLEVRVELSLSLSLCVAYP
jgi:hypothetical protein